MSNKLPKSIQRVVRIEGDGHAVTLYESKKKSKKKQNILLKPFEKGERRLAEALSKGAEAYLGEHRKSNRKKKNGWLWDFNRNSMKAARKAIKRFDMSKD